MAALAALEAANEVRTLHYAPPVVAQSTNASSHTLRTTSRGRLLPRPIRRTAAAPARPVDDALSKYNNEFMQRQTNEVVAPALPALIRGGCATWCAALNGVSPSAMANLFPQAQVTVGENEDGSGPIQVPLRDYARYLATTDDDSPLFVLESEVQHTFPSLARTLAARPLPCMIQDLLQLLPEFLPIEWLFIGARRSGPSFSTSFWRLTTWEAQLLGCRRWAFYRSDATIAAHEKDAVDWYLGTYPKLPPLERPAFECIQHAGDLLYIPDGWQYCAVCLDDSVAYSTARLDFSCLHHALPELSQQIEPNALRQFIITLRQTFPDIEIKEESFDVAEASSQAKE